MHMSENIVPFPSPEGVKVGLYELQNLTLNIRNIFEQTADRDRVLNDHAIIHQVVEEVQTIKDKVLAIIDGIDGIRPGLPSVDAFKAEAWELLCLPLTYGTGRASMGYYKTEASLNEVVHAYQRKLAELQHNALTNI